MKAYIYYRSKLSPAEDDLKAAHNFCYGPNTTHLHDKQKKWILAWHIQKTQCFTEKPAMMLHAITKMTTDIME